MKRLYKGIFALAIIFILTSKSWAISPTGQGIFLVSNCNSITNPINGFSWCVLANSAPPNIYEYIGNVWTATAGSGGLISGNVLLSTGTGTFTSSAITSTSYCACRDSTTPSNTCYTANPAAGSVTVTGNNSDTVQVYCTGTSNDVAVNLGSYTGPINLTGNSGNGSDKINQVNINNTINGASYGMKCDGSTDDSAALTAAITAAQSSFSGGINGTILQLPPGLCELASNITIGGNVPIIIQGSGTDAAESLGNARTTLQAKAGDTGIVLTLGDGISTLQNMILRDFTIDANSIAANGIECKSHGCDYIRAYNITVKNATSDGVLTASGSANVNMYWENLETESNAGRGLFLQGTVNNELFTGLKAYYNFPGSNGEQVQCGTGASRQGPVTFVSSDMEDNGTFTHNNIDYLNEGCVTTFINPYFETDSSGTDTAIELTANTVGEPVTVNMTGGFAQGNGTASFAIVLPSSSSTSNIIFNATGFYPFNYTCGGTCTSSNLAIGTPPIAGYTGTKVYFNSRGNSWFPDTSAAVNVNSGHLNSLLGIGTIPAAGTGSVTAGSTDNAFEVTGGTSPVTVTFGVAFANAPVCVCDDETSALGACKVTTSGTQAVVTTTGTDSFKAICLGK